MRDYDFDLMDDPVSIDMNQYSDNDIDTFIKPAPVGKGDVFVRLNTEQKSEQKTEQKKPDEQLNGSNCGGLGCNVGGTMAQIYKDAEEPVLDEDYDEKDIHNSIK